MKKYERKTYLISGDSLRARWSCKKANKSINFPPSVSKHLSTLKCLSTLKMPLHLGALKNSMSLTHSAWLLRGKERQRRLKFYICQAFSSLVHNDSRI